MFLTLGLIQLKSIKEYGIKILNKPISEKYDAIILAVAHAEFTKISFGENKIVR